MEAVRSASYSAGQQAGSTAAAEAQALAEAEANAKIDAAIADASTTLDLSFRNLGQVPGRVALVSSLQVLDLRSNNLTKVGGAAADAGEAAARRQQQHPATGELVVPNGGAFPGGLRLLYLSSNLIEVLEEPALAQLPELGHLDLSGNRLSKLPFSLLTCTSLVELSLARNQLDFLPASLGDCLGQLKVLDVSYNSLHSLPPSLGKLEHLERLDARFNQLSSVPAALGNARALRHLDVSCNFVNLTSIPGSLGFLSNMVELNLSNNHIEALPLQLGRCRALELLWLDNNPLSFPPPDVLGMEDPRDEALERTASTEAALKVEAARRRTKLCKAFLAAKLQEWEEEHGEQRGGWDQWFANWPFLHDWLATLFGGVGQPVGLLEGAAVSAVPRAMLMPLAKAEEPKVEEMAKAAAVAMAVSSQRVREDFQEQSAAGRAETLSLVGKQRAQQQMEPVAVSQPPRPVQVAVAVGEREEKERALAC